MGPVKVALRFQARAGNGLSWRDYPLPTTLSKMRRICIHVENLTGNVILRSNSSRVFFSRCDKQQTSGMDTIEFWCNGDGQFSIYLQKKLRTSKAQRTISRTVSFSVLPDGSSEEYLLLNWEFKIGTHHTKVSGCESDHLCVLEYTIPCARLLPKRRVCDWIRESPPLKPLYRPGERLLLDKQQQEKENIPEHNWPSSDPLSCPENQENQIPTPQSLVETSGPQREPCLENAILTFRGNEPQRRGSSTNDLTKVVPPYAQPNRIQRTSDYQIGFKDLEDWIDFF